MNLKMENLVLISNSDAWDLFLENLKLKEEILQLNLELTLNKVLNEGRTLVVIDRSLQSFPDE